MGSPNDSEKQRERLKELEVQKVTFEIERLNEQVEKHSEALESADLDIKEHISEQDEPTMRQFVKEQWYSLIKTEQERSDEIWANKKSFFQYLPNQPIRDRHYRERTDKKVLQTINQETNGSQSTWRQSHGKEKYIPCFPLSRIERIRIFIVPTTFAEIGKSKSYQSILL